MEQIESCVPPGFRFHPTEEELVGYYLQRKVNSLKFEVDVIADIDLYRMEPWDIQEKCKLGYDEQNEWYFFSHKDRKYPTGTRTNRATAAGFWKATGRDKPVLLNNNNKIIGMRKTLVFYKGRAPNGKKTDWITHEYRLQSTDHVPPQEEGWVVCRAFKKPSPSYNQGFGAWNHHNNFHQMRNTNDNNNSIMASLSVPDIGSAPDHHYNHNHSHHSHLHHHHLRHLPDSSVLQQPEFSSLDQGLMSSGNIGISNFIENQLIMELPRLESPSLSSSSFSNSNNYNPPSLQLVPHDYELVADQNQLGSIFLECFPNL